MSGGIPARAGRLRAEPTTGGPTPSRTNSRAYEEPDDETDARLRWTDGRMPMPTRTTSRPTTSPPRATPRPSGVAIGARGTGDRATAGALARHRASAALGSCVLVGIGAYRLLAGDAATTGVTLAIGVRREVSDAATAARIAADNAAGRRRASPSSTAGPDVFVYDAGQSDPLRQRRRLRARLVVGQRVRASRC